MLGAPETELGDYKHGVNTPNDIPAMLSVAAAYEFLPVLRASVEYHFYDDKNAGMANGKQKYPTKGTNEYLAGIEWDVISILSVIRSKVAALGMSRFECWLYVDQL